MIDVTVLAILLYLALGTSPDADTWSQVQQAIRRHDYHRGLNLAKKIVGEDRDDYYGIVSGIYYPQLENLNQAELEYSRAYELSAKDLKARLEAVGNRRARQGQIGPMRRVAIDQCSAGFI